MRMKLRETLRQGVDRRSRVRRAPRTGKHWSPPGSCKRSPADPRQPSNLVSHVHPRRISVQGFPVRSQNRALASSSNPTGCSPACWARSVARRALNRFWNFCLLRSWVRSMGYFRLRISQATPAHSKCFLNRRRASLIGSPTATTIRPFIEMRLVRLTRPPVERVFCRMTPEPAVNRLSSRTTWPPSSGAQLPIRRTSAHKSANSLWARSGSNIFSKLCSSE